MSASAQCPHSDLAVHVNIVHLRDSNVGFLELTAKCNVCGEPMQFLGGFPVGCSMAFPAVSPDAQELRLPFVGAGEQPDKAEGFTISTPALGRGRR